MKRFQSGMKYLTSIWLVILIILFSGAVKAAEPQPEKSALPQGEEEVPTEQKPPEKLPEVIPPYMPGVAPIAPYATYSQPFASGPITGSAAPYGYDRIAKDTLMRGWQTHQLGSVKVTPYFEYDALYRSNVFQTNSNKQSDFANMINPGIRLELPVAGTHRLSLGYLGNYFIYSRFSDNSHYDQNVNADAALNFNKLSLRAGTTYRNATEEATLIQTGPILTFSRQRHYNMIMPYVQAAYNMADRWRIQADYQFNYLSFTKSIDRFDDFQDHTLGATMFYKFWPKTSALVQFIADIRHHPFNPTNDNVVYTPMAGLTWEPTARLSGTIKVGYTIADYSHNNSLINNNRGGFDPNGLALSIQAIYKLSRYTTLSLTAQRSLQEDPNSLNDAYFNSGLIFTVSHFWHAFDLTSYASFAYYNNDYVFNNFDPGTGQLKKRNDNIIYVGAGVSRPITRWLRARLDYFYYNRGSNFGFYPTNEHMVLLGLQTSF